VLLDQATTRPTTDAKTTSDFDRIALVDPPRVRPGNGESILGLLSG
jgi:hypothetical protein